MFPSWRCTRASVLSGGEPTLLHVALLYGAHKGLMGPHLWMTLAVHVGQCPWEILRESQGHRHLFLVTWQFLQGILSVCPFGWGHSGSEKELYNHICSGWLLIASLWDCSGHVQLGGDLGADQNTLEGFHISFVELGMPQFNPGRPGRFGVKDIWLLCLVFCCHKSQIKRCVDCRRFRMHFLTFSLA